MMNNNDQDFIIITTTNSLLETKKKNKSTRRFRIERAYFPDNLRMEIFKNKNLVVWMLLYK